MRDAGPGVSPDKLAQLTERFWRNSTGEGSGLGLSIVKAIAELVWDMNFDSNTNVVEVAIKRLRDKIDVPFSPKLLHTIRGMGYVMEVRDVQAESQGEGQAQ